MPITRLNHAVLYVRDVDVTKEFYENVLGFETLIFMPGRGACMSEAWIARAVFSSSLATIAREVFDGTAMPTQML